MRYLTWNEYVRLVLSYAVFSRNEDGSWTVEVPVLPGCITWGATRAEAAVMAEDAVQGWLVTALRFGDEIPVSMGIPWAIRSTFPQGRSRRMPKLSPEKPLVVTQKLRRLGYEGPFGGGRHVFMRHPESRIKISVPAHGGRDIPVGTFAAIIKQAGISVEDWLAL